MKKVISFCLWGNKAIYNVGAVRNATIAKEIYPDFECWFYIHKESVPEKTIEDLIVFDNVKIIFRDGDLQTCQPMFWRMEPIDDENVEILMSRDTDSRLSMREKTAVDEWIISDNLFHIMRDHPCHNQNIMGGMFGTKKIPEILNWNNEIDKYRLLHENDIENKTYFYDQHFLRDYIYPIVRDRATIHASFNRFEASAEYFPTDYNESYDFVGEYVYEDEYKEFNYTLFNAWMSK